MKRLALMGGLFLVLSLSSCGGGGVGGGPTSPSTPSAPTVGYVISEAYLYEYGQNPPPESIGENYDVTCPNLTSYNNNCVGIIATPVAASGAVNGTPQIVPLAMYQPVTGNISGKGSPYLYSTQATSSGGCNLVTYQIVASASGVSVNPVNTTAMPETSQTGNVYGYPTLELSATGNFLLDSDGTNSSCALRVWVLQNHLPVSYGNQISISGGECYYGATPSDSAIMAFEGTTSSAYVYNYTLSSTGALSLYSSTQDDACATLSGIQTIPGDNAHIILSFDGGLGITSVNANGLPGTPCTSQIDMYYSSVFGQIGGPLDFTPDGKVAFGTASGFNGQATFPIAYTLPVLNTNGQLTMPINLSSYAMGSVGINVAKYRSINPPVVYNPTGTVLYNNYIPLQLSSTTDLPTTPVGNDFPNPLGLYPVPLTYVPVS